MHLVGPIPRAASFLCMVYLSSVIGTRVAFSSDVGGHTLGGSACTYAGLVTDTCHGPPPRTTTDDNSGHHFGCRTQDAALITRTLNNPLIIIQIRQHELNISFPKRELFSGRVRVGNADECFSQHVLCNDIVRSAQAFAVKGFGIRAIGFRFSS